MDASALPPPPSRLRPGNVPLNSLVLPESFPDGTPHFDEIVKHATRQPHSWTRCPGGAFKVRCGPNYSKNRRKAPSAPSLYEVFAVDAYSSETKLAHIGRVAELPPDPAPPPPDCGLPSYVIINWMVPNYAPSSLLTQAKRTNGPGWNIVLYCRLSDDARARLARSAATKGGHGAPADSSAADSSAPGPAGPAGAASSRAAAPADAPAGAEAASSRTTRSLELLRRFMHPTDGARLRGERLKCIIGLADTEKPSFGMVLKTMILRYNFKPFLSKTASFCYHGPGYFEIDIDIHTWGMAALSALNTVKEKMASLLPRAAVTIEAEADDEMPEQVLAGVFLSNIDPARATPIAEELAAYLNNAEHHTPALERNSKVSHFRGDSPTAADLVDGDHFEIHMSRGATPPPTDTEDNNSGRDDAESDPPPSAAPSIS